MYKARVATGGYSSDRGSSAGKASKRRPKVKPDQWAAVAGLSIAQQAKQLGVSQRTVCRYRARSVLH